MSSKRPWYKRFPQDFIGGTMGMSLEERGAYSIILDLIYDKGGRVPDSARDFCIIMGINIRRWARLRDSLIERGKIAIDAEGFITNPRATRELLDSGESLPNVSPKNPKTLPKVLGNSPSITAKINDLRTPILEARSQKLEARQIPLAKAKAERADLFDEPKQAEIEEQPNLEKVLFRRGRAVLGASAGGLINRILKAAGDPERALEAIETAATADKPREWIGGFLKSRGSQNGRQISEEWRKRGTAEAALGALVACSTQTADGRGGQANLGAIVELLPAPRSAAG